jgi:beta-N-acetylhexosaminidase
MRSAAMLSPSIALTVATILSASAQDIARPEPGATEERLVLHVETTTPPPRSAVPLDAMIGQMIVIGFPGQNPADEWPKRVASMIQDGRIGGVVLFSENVVSPSQLKKLVSSLLPDQALPPFISVDQEGGGVQRLAPIKGFVGLPSAHDIAKLDQIAAYRLYRRNARQLADLGINLNFGPVVDLNVNVANPVIGRLGRSYDRNPERVIAFARHFIGAHDQVGVLTSAKHFPGHGSASADPHHTPVDISQSWKESELDPFRDLIGDNFVEMIMVSHLVHPRFSDRDRPASLSRRAIQDVLRGELGFRGLVVTDDLDMKAITARYSVDKAAVLAAAAGADLIVVANNKKPDAEIAERIRIAISHAVASGDIPRKAIEDAYDRILKVKKKLQDRRLYALSNEKAP